MKSGRLRARRIARVRPLALLLLVALLAAGQLPAAGTRTEAPDRNHEPAHPAEDQGLNGSEEPVFASQLPRLLEHPDVDMLITMRPASAPAGGCPLAGDVYWVYAARGTICFTRAPAGDGWSYDVRVVAGRNPLRDRDHTALATLAEERAASSTTLEDPDPRNLVDAGAVTYPFAYERIVAEFDSPRSGDFVIVPANTADRGNKGAHGHLGITQSRSTLLIAGRGARRSPLTAAEEAALEVKHVDLAPTVAQALGVQAYMDDTGEPARSLNGEPSPTALLGRQDGRPLDALLEPVFNVFVVSVDGLRPGDVTPTLMPNLTGLLDEPCEPGGACATAYEEARAMMVTETNGNHVAMMTGAYGAASGIFANESLDRSAGEEIDLDRPELNLAETLFDAIESQKPWLRTAGVFGKEKLRDLFDCTRDAEGDCAPSADNPEGVPVSHAAPDVLAGATTSPSDPDLDCPAEPGSGSGYTHSDCVMDAALGILGSEDPDLTFINLGDTDGLAHLFGPDSPQAQAAVRLADEQIGRLVEALRTSGRWQRSVLVVTADHNFGDTADPSSRIFLDQVFDGAGPAPFEVLTHGGSASVFLTELTDPAGSPTAEQQETLAELRARALEVDGIAEALYRLPNAADGGAAHTVDAVHPDWHLGGTGRIGELLITAEEDRVLLPGPGDQDTVVAGHHGHPTDRHVPFVVASGGTYVRDGVVTPAFPAAVNEADDTAALEEQAETVDVAPTVAWLLGVDAPAQSAGRVLSEAFWRHPLEAHERGDITEPIANRAAIFIFDGNNSVEVHCLLDPETCGEPVPDQATDPGFVPRLRELAENGLLTAYGSVAGWPSVTFPNHNTIGTGAYPGHHGIVNNRYYDRSTGVRHDFFDNQQHPLFHFTQQFLSEDVETLHEAVHRTYGDWAPQDGPQSDKAYTAAVNEPSARGADYATLEPDRSYPLPETIGATENPADLAQDTTQACAQADQGYFEESVLDQTGQTQARRLYDAAADHPLPKYLINNFTLTDGAGHHFGPHTSCALAAYRDADRRLTRILDAMEGAGVLGETLIIVTGDHGMENEDLERRGLPSDFSAFLDEDGVEHVMADWHVYLLTVDVEMSQTDFKRAEEATVTFTARDDDTGTPVEGAQVTVESVGDGGRASEDGSASGTTDADGRVTLTFTPRGESLEIAVTGDGFNEHRRTIPLVCPGRGGLAGTHIVGSPGPDLLIGSGGRDILCGQGGGDRIRAGTGDDVVVGGPGRDTLLGGAGDDLLAGLAGRDLVRGGPGHDVLRGGGRGDVLTGGGGRDVLNGGPGPDRCRGGPGADVRRSC